MIWFAFQNFECCSLLSARTGGFLPRKDPRRKFEQPASSIRAARIRDGFPQRLSRVAPSAFELSFVDRLFKRTRTLPSLLFCTEIASRTYARHS